MIFGKVNFMGICELLSRREKWFLGTDGKVSWATTHLIFIEKIRL